MLSTPFALMAFAILAFTSLSARGFGGDERFEGGYRGPAQSTNRPAYNAQNRINQVPGGKAVENAALYNRGMENGAGGGTVYQQAPAQPTYPAAPPTQTPY